MKIELIKPTGETFACNCWLIDIDGENVIAVDIGVSSRDFLTHLGNRRLKAVLLTHGHFDHIAGVEGVRKFSDADVYIADGDMEMLTDPKKSLAVWSGCNTEPVEICKIAKETLKIAGVDIEVIPTPGHTKGSVTYKIGNMLFTGDTLFKGTVGRTDLPGGNMDILMSSVDVLKNQDGDFTIYPGHNDITTLGFERINNPYLQ